MDVHKQTGDVLIFLLQFLKHETIVFHHQNTIKTIWPKKQGEGRLSRILALGPNNPKKRDKTPKYVNEANINLSDMMVQEILEFDQVESKLLASHKHWRCRRISS